MAIPAAKVKANREKFAELAKKPADDQLEFFLKSFIFALDDRWKDVVTLLGEFQKYVQRGGEGKPDLNFVQAAEFLQKHGKTRIAQEIKDELKDIDLDNNSRISFIEYLLIHFKVMVLAEFYKRHETAPVEDLSVERDGVGIVGVGDKLLEELFEPKSGLPPDLVAAIEEFTAKKREKEKKVKDLETKAAAGGVKGAAAANELSQLQASDKTEFNRLELTLNAAKRKAAKGSGDAALQAKKQKEEAERKKAEEEARQKMLERKKLWEQGGGDKGDVKSGVTSFNKGNLKKTVTTDKSRPVLKASVEDK